jgi:hypothetical protein
MAGDEEGWHVLLLLASMNVVLAGWMADDGDVFVRWWPSPRVGGSESVLARSRLAYDMTKDISMSELKRMENV